MRSHKKQAARLLLVFIVLLLGSITVIVMSIRAGQQVESSTGHIAKNRIPELQQIGQVQKDMSSRATNLYVYYATLEREQWHVQDQALSANVISYLQMLGRPDAESSRFQALLRAFDEQARLFDAEMSKGAARDWDRLREILESAQTVLSTITVMLNQWSSEIRQSADVDSQATIAEVTQLTRLQQSFSLAVIVVAIFVLVSLYARIKDQELLYRHAYFDDVTTLPNLRMLHEDLSTALASSSGALLLINIHKLRQISSTYGHETSDALIVHAARWMEGCLLRHDRGCKLYRLNSDTLALLLNSPCSREEIEGLCRTLLEIERSELSLSGRAHQVSIKIGTTLFPTDGRSVPILIRNANAALSTLGEMPAFAFYLDEMTQRSDAWLSMERNLRNAIGSQEFSVFYQPKVRSSDCRIVSAEALIRWQCNGEFVSPGTFIPIAEESGLVLPIGNWVLQEACRQWREWPEDMQARALAVNISAQQFQDPGFPDFVDDTLRSFNVPPGSIELEITEAVAADHPDKVIATMHRLKKIGVSLAIDDFGTGYSSLGYLQRFPIDVLKIDQMFVRRLTTEADGEALIRLMLGLAREIGLKVVAEGVETSQQRDQLAAMGCDLLQGYLFSKPLPAKDYAALVLATVEK